MNTIEVIKQGNEGLVWANGVVCRLDCCWQPTVIQVYKGGTFASTGGSRLEYLGHDIEVIGKPIAPPKATACSSPHMPAKACNQKAIECPAEGYYWVQYHVCGCCAGPEVAYITQGVVMAIGDNGPWPTWENFNGHILGRIEAPAKPIASEERVERKRREWLDAAQVA